MLLECIIPRSSEILDLFIITYIKELREQNAIDFDDMIIRAIQEVECWQIYS